MTTKIHKPSTFEADLLELEQVVAKMEAGQLSLEDSLSAYQRGAVLLQQCRQRLDEVQQQVRVLEEGTLKNFADSAKVGDV